MTEISEMTQATEAENDALLAPWTGPYGGLPPFGKADPAAVERAYQTAITRKLDEVRAIAANPDLPTFDNMIVALEDSGRELRRVATLFGVFSSTMSDDAMREMEQRLAPLMPALEDAIAHNEALFGRIKAVHDKAQEGGLSPERRRLTQLIHDRLLRRGAGLEAAAKARLAEINGELARLQARFNQNLIAEQDSQVLLLENEGELEGLNDELQAAAANTAAERGQGGRWAIPNRRPSVWPVLTLATRRDVREKVWRMWVQRGANPGERDNRPVMTDMLRLRGEKARLLGFNNYAELATADRMAGSPDAAIAMMERVWERVVGPTLAQISELQALADAEGGNFLIAPWDRLYYAEKLRQRRFGLDAEAVKPYLELGSILDALFWQADRLYGFKFTAIPDASVCHPDIKVFGLSRDDEPVGALWFDLFQRQGKMQGSWQSEYRPAENFRERVLPLSSINSNILRPKEGEPVLLTWSQANVLFHEFGHAMHMLCNQATYPSLGSMAVPWDFVEVPALLNERWLMDRELLTRFAVHYKTGQPIPSELIDSIEQANRFDRVFSVTLDYLGTAMVDMRLHLMADGRDIDAIGVEQDVLAELNMPSAVELTLRASHAVHTFSEYAAGVYVYLWADVMAADIADAFTGAGSFYDRATADRWRRDVLSVGASVPADQAFFNFRGRDPDPDSLLNRFGLLDA